MAAAVDKAITAADVVLLSGGTSKGAATLPTAHSRASPIPAS
jgi:molybdopterin biosynthesis enzyme